ncbi:hypothetical protein AADS67_004982 [Escherichia coli]|nr:hypothetical protein [Serratia marcescens]
MGISIVVPKAFGQFAQNENLLLYERLISLLHEENPKSGLLAGRKLVAGQGLNQEQVSHAWFVGTSKGMSEEFKHWHASRGKSLATKPLVHKHRAENTLISEPECGQDGTFVADLILHEHNELMLDHLTGQHVQGMVLTEACRQMFLAVTEKFCLQNYTAAKRYFVINTMSVRFQAFAFPLPAQIHYQILEQKQLKPDRIAFHADMDIHQGDQVVAGMEVKFTVFDDMLISQRESQLAATAVQRYVGELRSLTSTDASMLSMPAFPAMQTAVHRAVQPLQ